jgi:hypothetical protein
MAEVCLRAIIEIEAKANICQLSSSYLLDHEVKVLEKEIFRRISPGLVYACRY